MKRPVTTAVFLLGTLLFVSAGAESFWGRQQVDLKDAAQAKAEAAELQFSDEDLIIDLDDYDPMKINIPSEYGVIIELWKPEPQEDNAAQPKTMVIEIQDPHCNVEGQHNISRILKFLMEAYALDFVAVEGASGYVDVENVNTMPNQPLKDALVDYFFKRGRITGVEYLALTDKKLDFAIYGIESIEKYDENYKAYIETTDIQKDAETLFTAIFNQLELIRRNLYTSNLIKFDDKVYAHKFGETGIGEYISILYQYITADGKPDEAIMRRFPWFWRMLRTLQMEESVDFAKAEKDRDTFVEKLTELLSEEEVREMTKKTLQFKLARLSQYTYYSYLTNLAQQHELDISPYKNFYDYIKYLKVSSEVNFLKLKDDMDDMEMLIYESMFQSQDQREFNAIKYKTYILKSLFNLTLTRKEWNHYMEHSDTITIQALRDYLNSYKQYLDGHKLEYINTTRVTIAPAVEFYHKALERDTILVNNGLKEAQRLGNKCYIQVTGGFHAEGIKELLRKKNIPYIILNPKISEGNNQDFYYQVMHNQKTELEKSMGTTLLQ